MAAIVPEPPAVLKEFATRLSIPFPLLSDEDARVIRAFGLSDERFHKEGEAPSRLPYAGNFLLGADGVVRARFFEEPVEIRRTAGSILVHQGAGGTAAETADLQHLVLRTSASNEELMPGQCLTLVLDLEAEPGHHVYARTAPASYRPLTVTLDEDALFEPHAPQYPPARTMFFAPLAETVPVYEGRFRVLQDVTLQFRPALARFQGATPYEAVLTGRLGYQVCSTTVCFPPRSAPLRWAFRVRRWVK